MPKKIFLIFQLIILNTIGTFSQTTTIDSVSMAGLFERALSSKDSSTYYIKEAEKLTRSHKLTSQFQYSMGRYYFMTRKLDSAIVYSTKAIDFAESTKNDYWLMRNYVLSGSIKSLRKEYHDAIQLFILGQQKAVELKDTTTSASIMSNIGNTYFGIKDYDAADRYLEEAFKLFSSQKDTIHSASTLAVRSLALLQKKKFDEAQNIAEQGLAFAKKHNNLTANVIVNHCLGEIERYKKKYNEALDYFNLSLNLAQKANLSHYILLNSNGIHATLTDNGQCNEAIIKGEEVLAVAHDQSNIDITTVIKRNLSTCYAKMGNYAKAYQYFKESYELYDSTSNLENKIAMTNLLSRLEIEQKDKEILSANVKILEQNNSLEKRNKYIFALLGLASILGLIFYFSRKINQEKIIKIQLEKNQEILLSEITGEELERTRISHELHDGVAGSIVGVKAKLSHLGQKASVDTSEITALLTDVHKEIRTISHNLLLPDLENNSISEALQNYLFKYFPPDKKYHINGTINEGNMGIITKKTIYRVTQEAIQNAVKHANASDVFINLMTKNDSHEILVEDNGTGFDTAIIKTNQGLSSLNSRIKEMGGTLTIDSSIKNGTIVNISIPVIK